MGQFENIIEGEVLQLTSMDDRGNHRGIKQKLEQDLTLTDTGGKFLWPAQGGAETTHRA